MREYHHSGESVKPLNEFNSLDAPSSSEARGFPFWNKVVTPAIGAPMRFTRYENASHSGTAKILHRQAGDIMAWQLAQPARGR